MDNKVEIFNHEQFGKIRTVYKEEDNEVWFVARDLSKRLGYKSIERMYDHVDREDKVEINPQNQSYQGSCENGSTTLEPNPNVYRMMLINESGLYSAIFGSQLPQAKLFKRWVTSEVLPSIRKNGGYISNQENSTPAEIVANALIVANNIIIEKEQRLKEVEEKLELQAPKVKAWSQFMDVDKSIDIGEFSKILNIKGLGRNNLMELLRNKKIFRANNEPYQSYVDSGYFRVIAINNFYSPTKTLITPKGMMWLHKKLQEIGYLTEEI